MQNRELFSNNWKKAVMLQVQWKKRNEHNDISEVLVTRVWHIFVRSMALSSFAVSSYLEKLKKCQRKGAFSFMRRVLQWNAVFWNVRVILGGNCESWAKAIKCTFEQKFKIFGVQIFCLKWNFPWIKWLDIFLIELKFDTFIFYFFLTDSYVIAFSICLSLNWIKFVVDKMLV